MDIFVPDRFIRTMNFLVCFYCKFKFSVQLRRFWTSWPACKVKSLKCLPSSFFGCEKRLLGAWLILHLKDALGTLYDSRKWVQMIFITPLLFLLVIEAVSDVLALVFRHYGLETFLILELEDPRFCFFLLMIPSLACWIWERAYNHITSVGINLKRSDLNCNFW